MKNISKVLLFLSSALLVMHLARAEPVGSCSEGSFLPDSEDCAVFYICRGGKPVVFPCLVGLHFNADLKVCVPPEIANCQN